MKTTYFNFDIPTQPNDHKILGNVLASADALAVSEIAEQYDGLTVVVTQDTKSAVRLSQVLPDLTSQPFLHLQITSAIVSKWDNRHYRRILPGLVLPAVSLVCQPQSPGLLTRPLPSRNKSRADFAHLCYSWLLSKWHRTCCTQRSL